MKNESALNATAPYLELSRRAAGLSPEDAAIRIGVSTSTINRWEREGVTKKVRFNVFAKICNTYVISADNLCSLIDQRP